MLYGMHVKLNGDFTIHHEQTVVPDGQVVSGLSSIILQVSIFSAEFTVGLDVLLTVHHSISV
jgi:hypothetical protein